VCSIKRNLWWCFLPGLLLAGCSYTSIEVQRAETCPYRERPVLVVGHLAGASQAFYEGLYGQLENVRGLDLVEETPDFAPCTGAILTGLVTADLPDEIGWDSEWDENFWRVVGRKTVGLGSGKSVVRGEFSLTTIEGEELVHFVAVENYPGGSGVGGYLDYPAMVVGMFRWGGEVMVSSVALGAPVASSPLPYPHDFVGEETLERRLGGGTAQVVANWFRGEPLE